jgi:hemolysin III
MSLFQTKIERPLLRGHFHQAAFFIALGACAMLIAKSDNGLEYFSTSIYTIGIMGMYGMSALYHRPQWSRSNYLMIRRLDHSAIFIMIAGTATPIALLGLKGQEGMNLASIFWIVAFAGMLQAAVWTHGPKWVRAVFYVAAGWVALPYFSDLNKALGTTNVVLLLVGGVIYTTGAVIYGLKRPDPFPKVFGYHEIFHILVVIASVFHFIVITRLVNVVH